LIAVGNKPIILYCVEDLLRCGITDIGIVLGDNHPEKVTELLGDGTRFGAKFTYVPQGSPRGIAHAIECARQYLGRDRFVVYLGDNILRDGIAGFVQEFSSSEADGMILLSRVKDANRFGVAQLDHEGRILSLVEKPENPVSDLALVGVYFLSSAIFPLIEGLEPSGRGEYEITDALRGLMGSGGNLIASIVTGWWKDTGRVEDILEANRLVLDGMTPGDGTGGSEPGRGIVIEMGCRIIPPVVMGDNCRLKEGAIVGPYVSLGSDSTVSRAVIENTVLDAGVKVDCDRRISGSLIGRGSMIRASRHGCETGSGKESLTLVLGENSEVIL